MQAPYKALCHYFGVFNNDLSLNTSTGFTINGTFVFPVFVSKDVIVNLLKRTMDITIDEDNTVFDLLWLNANLNFDDVPEKNMGEAIDQLNYDDALWPIMKEDILNMAILLRQSEEGYGPISIKVDRAKTIRINNCINWFSRLFDEQCVKKVFGDISNDELQAELDNLEKQKERLKKWHEHRSREKRRKEKAIACGLSDLFLDNGLISTAANAQFLNFVNDYLLVMRYITQKEHDSYLFTETIRAWINGSRKKKPRLDTSKPFKKCTLEDLKPTEEQLRQKRFFDLITPLNK